MVVATQRDDFQLNYNILGLLPDIFEQDTHLLFRKKKSTSAVPKPAEEWDDTPETFPVEAVFRKSCTNWKRYMIVLLAAISLSGCIGLKMISDITSAVSDTSNTNLHPFSAIPYLGASVVLDLIVVVFIFSAMPSQITKARTQRERVQEFVNKNGTDSIPHLIDLLLLRIKERRPSTLTETIVYNLTCLFAQIDTHTKLELSTNQIDLLIGLINPEGEFSKGLSKREKRNLILFSIMVAPSVMHMVGVAGGESGANALLRKFRCSSSVKVKQKIREQLHQLSVDYHILTSESEGGTYDQLFTSINRKSQSPKQYDFSSFRTILLFLSFMLPSFFL